MPLRQIIKLHFIIWVSILRTLLRIYTFLSGKNRVHPHFTIFFCVRVLLLAKFDLKSKLRNFSLLFNVTFYIKDFRAFSCVINTFSCWINTFSCWISHLSCAFYFTPFLTYNHRPSRQEAHVCDER